MILMRKKQRLFTLTMAFLLIAALFAGCSGKGLAQFSEPKKGQLIATFQVRDFGEIKVMLFPDQAPKGVENFTTLAKQGYYDGVTFHRVIDDFMIQGGDPEGTGAGGESIWGEGFGVEYDGSLRNFTGAIAYANAGPNSNGSQFFIVNAPAVSDEELELIPSYIKQQYGFDVDFPDEVKAKYKEVGGYPFLDGSYTVFGQVIEGLDVVKAIMQTEVQLNDWGTEESSPVEPVIIDSIVISEYEG